MVCVTIHSYQELLETTTAYVIASSAAVAIISTPQIGLLIISYRNDL